MTDHPSSPEVDPSGAPLASLAARLRLLPVAHPRAFAAAMYVAVAVVAAIAAYLAIFTQFASYDDEGTLLVSLKAFVNGDALYREAYSPYGPFYYELFGSFFSLTGLSVTNDVSRLIVIAVWVGACVTYGVSVQRLSGRLLLGLAAAIVAYPVLSIFVNEPMHPHGLCVLLLAGLTLLLASGPPRRVALAGAGAGVLLAALILTKVNLGGLAIAAIALAAVLTIEPLYRRRWFRWLVVVAFLALPTAVMARELRADWVRELIALEFLATVALLVVARMLQPRKGESDEGLSRWVLGACAGFAAAAVAIVGVLLLTGSGLSDLYDGSIVQGLKIGDAFVIPFTSPSAAVDWGIAAVAAAVLTLRLRGGSSDTPSIWPGLLRSAAGLAIWITLARSAPFSLNPESNQLALPLVLVWVAAVPLPGSAEAPYWRFIRIALPALALAETMQVYPVAGSQTGIAGASFVAVGGLCLADGLRELRTWSAARGPRTLERFGLVAAVVVVALAAQIAFGKMLRPAANNFILYRDQPALAFEGADLIHPPAGQVTEYSELVDLLRSHGCTTFIGYPNLNSLYLWSGIDPPKPSAPGAWVAVLDDEGQGRIVDQMRASARPCAIRNNGAANFWLQDKPAPEEPVISYLNDDFKVVGQVGEWEFLVPTAKA